MSQVFRIAFFALFAQVAFAQNIEILSSTPIDEELEQSDLVRFQNEGLINKDEAQSFTNSTSSEDWEENSLVNIYHKISSALNKDSRESSADSAQNEDIPSLLENIYGHVGFFGKTNILNKTVGGSYGNFTGSAGLRYNFKEMVFLELGIYGIAPIAGNHTLTRDSRYKAFITHRASVKYIAKDENAKPFFDITVGRFLERRDWIRNYGQGMQLNVNYDWLKLWLDWLDEQAIANREFVSDFDNFKRAYNDEWLFAGGLGVSIFGVDALPYYYLMNDNFWTGGVKLGLDIEFSDKKWRNITTLHFAHLKNQRTFRANQAKQSQIVWFEEALRWREDEKSVAFGVGYLQTFGAYFELANIGNFSRFEAYNSQGYGIIAPGGIDNGGNSSNAFFANTRSIYSFIGFRIEDFAMNFLGRNSKGDNAESPQKLTQHQYSLGARYRIIDGVYIGGVGAFMLENKKNKSYAKGYIEFRI